MNKESEEEGKRGITDIYELCERYPGRTGIKAAIEILGVCLKNQKEIKGERRKQWQDALGVLNQTLKIENLSEEDKPDPGLKISFLIQQVLNNIPAGLSEREYLELSYAYHAITEIREKAEEAIKTISREPAPLIRTENNRLGEWVRFIIKSHPEIISGLKDFDKIINFLRREDSGLEFSEWLDIMKELNDLIRTTEITETNREDISYILGDLSAKAVRMPMRMKESEIEIAIKEYNSLKQMISKKTEDKFNLNPPLN
ncbi:MAG: hypothetical protein L6Q54_12905 [Leptospiraceae bacterium]|nr:hypothetical protein [Leptospiraceae bacterium]